MNTPTANHDRGPRATTGTTHQLGRLVGQGSAELGQSGAAHAATHRTLPPAPCPRDGDRGAVSGPELSLLEAAAGLLALVQIGRGQLQSEAEQRIAELERAVMASAVRGRLDAWDVELLEASQISSPARALAWLCVRRAVTELGAELQTARVDGRGIVVGSRRPRPWDVVRALLVTVPRSTLELEAFGALIDEANLEVDQAERAPRLPDALAQLHDEHRRQSTLSALLPIVAALDAGAPLEDTATRLREAALLFGDREPASSRRAA